MSKTKCTKCNKDLTKAQAEGVFTINEIKIGPYCSKCWEVVKTCTICSKPKYWEEDIHYYGDGMFVCDTCKPDHLGVCTGCGEEKVLHSGHGGLKLCSHCNNQLFPCGHCGEPTLHEMTWLPQNDSTGHVLLRMQWPGIYKKHDNTICIKCFHKIKSKFKKVATHKCKRCQNLFNKNFAKDKDGKDITDYCRRCWEKYMYECVECNKLGVRDQRTLCTDGGKFMCNACAVRFYRCNNCNQFFVKKDVPFKKDGKGRHICFTCHSNKQCSKCGKFKPEDSMSKKNPTLCRHCYDNTNPCSKCGVHSLEVVPNGRTGDYLCRLCACEKGVEHAHIWNYSYKPFPVIHGDGDELIVGIENEMSCKKGSKTPKILAQILPHYPDNLLFAKSDSSVYNGFEIVTNPMTFNYFKQVDWSHLFPKGILSAKEVEALDHTDGSGHVQKYTGMHIHLSKGHFTTFHLYKFINFLYNNHSFIEKVAERKSNKYCHNFPNYQEVKKSSKKKQTSSRSFIYMPANTRTVELRFFAGCHTVEMMNKNVEFVQALHEFSMIASKEASLKVKNFTNYVKDNADRFPCFAKFLGLV